MIGVILNYRDKTGKTRNHSGTYSVFGFKSTTTVSVHYTWSAPYTCQDSNFNLLLFLFHNIMLVILFYEWKAHGNFLNIDHVEVVGKNIFHINSVSQQSASEFYHGWLILFVVFCWDLFNTDHADCMIMFPGQAGYSYRK